MATKKNVQSYSKAQLEKLAKGTRKAADYWEKELAKKSKKKK